VILKASQGKESLTTRLSKSLDEPGEQEETSEKDGREDEGTDQISGARLLLSRKNSDVDLKCTGTPSASMCIASLIEILSNPGRGIPCAQ
jgi:hypothetical protein